MHLSRNNDIGDYSPDNCSFKTRLENNREKSATILNEKKVRDIKELIHEGLMCLADIGRLYGVTRMTVSAIKNGRIWKDVLGKTNKENAK